MQYRKIAMPVQISILSVLPTRNRVQGRKCGTPMLEAFPAFCVFRYHFPFELPDTGSSSSSFSSVRAQRGACMQGPRARARGERARARERERERGRERKSESEKEGGCNCGKPRETRRRFGSPHSGPNGTHAKSEFDTRSQEQDRGPLCLILGAAMRVLLGRSALPRTGRCYACFARGRSALPRAGRYYACIARGRSALPRAGRCYACFARGRYSAPPPALWAVRAASLRCKRTKQRPPDLGKPFVVNRFRIGMDALSSRLTLFFCAFFGAQDPPCEAWRSMVAPTDQARSREGREGRGDGRRGLAPASGGALRACRMLSRSILLPPGP